MTLPLTTGPLAPLRDRPLAEPVARAASLRPGYRDHPLDQTDPRQADPMVEATGLGLKGRNYYHDPANPPYHQRIPGSVPDLLLRTPVAQALAGVNARLAPYGLELWLFDAWRPIAVQNHFHDHWMPDYLRARDPSLTGAALAQEVERYWARGAPGGMIDPASPPPHATGAAVDLTIRHKDGAHLFMGSIFDDVTAVSNTDHFEDRDTSFSDAEARANRRLLYWLMEDAGLVNNPTEWWHFSMGDQMWARLTGADSAYYGPAYST